jgi:TatA/E family protein of Tat protein translocase
MGPLGFTEIAFIFVLALLIFGPKKLPEIGRTLGRGVAEFRKATTELKRSINNELALDEIPTPSKLRALAFDEPDEAVQPVVEPVRLPEEAPALTAARPAAQAAAPEPSDEPR